VRRYAWEEGGCFCGSVDFLISLNASLVGDPDKGAGDLDGGDSVNEVWMRFADDGRSWFCRQLS